MTFGGGITIVNGGLSLVHVGGEVAPLDSSARTAGPRSRPAGTGSASVWGSADCRSPTNPTDGRTPIAPRRAGPGSAVRGFVGRDNIARVRRHDLAHTREPVPLGPARRRRHRPLLRPRPGPPARGHDRGGRRPGAGVGRRVRRRVRRPEPVRQLRRPGRRSRHRGGLHLDPAPGPPRRRAAGDQRRQARAVREAVHDGRRRVGRGDRRRPRPRHVPDGGDVDPAPARHPARPRDRGRRARWARS